MSFSDATVNRTKIFLISLTLAVALTFFPSFYFNDTEFFSSFIKEKTNGNIQPSSDPCHSDSIESLDYTANSWIPVPLDERSKYPVFDGNGTCTHPYKHCCIGQCRQISAVHDNVNNTLYQKWKGVHYGLLDLLKLMHSSQEIPCNLWFVGASLSSDHFMGAMCELTAQGYNVTKCRTKSEAFRELWGDHDVCSDPIPDIPNETFSVAYFELEHQNQANDICPNGVKLLTSFPFNSSNSALNPMTQLLELGGVMLYNWGVHCNQHGCIDQKLKDTLLPFLNTRYAKPWKILWRETEPQHFSTKGGLFHPKRGGGCASHDYLDSWRNVEAARALNGSIPVVPIFKPLQSRWEWHCALIFDCTHYAYTPWRLDITWHGMYLALQSLACKKKEV